MAAFSEPDAVETEFGVSCDHMSADRLVAYIKRSQELLGRDISLGKWDFRIFEAMKQHYGTKTAGLIVKWVFYKYRGVYDREIVTMTKFAKGRRWWTDKMHQEMQAALRIEDSRTAKAKPASTGFATARDL